MSILTVTNDFVANTTIQSSQVNQNFTDVEYAVNTYTITEGSGLHGGEITASLSGNDLVISIVTLDGSAPTPANPVYVMIDKEVRSIEGSLSLTLPSGVIGNARMNLSSASLNANFGQIFVYVTWNTAINAINLGVSRVWYGRQLSDFASFNDNNEKTLCAVFASGASTDRFHVVGRITARQNSSYNWTFSKVEQGDIRETEWLNFTPQYPTNGGMDYTATTTEIAQYRHHGVNMDVVYRASGTIATAPHNAVAMVQPMDCSAANSRVPAYVFETGDRIGWASVAPGSSNFLFYKGTVANYTVGATVELGLQTSYKVI